MELGLQGKTAIVTGASKGIGLAVAEGLAAEGCAVHIVARTAGDLEAARLRLMVDNQVGVTVHAMDLSAKGQAEALAASAGPVDILVNNAGAIPGGSLDRIACSSSGGLASITKKPSSAAGQPASSRSC